MIAKVDTCAWLCCKTSTDLLVMVLVQIVWTSIKCNLYVSFSCKLMITKIGTKKSTVISNTKTRYMIQDLVYLFLIILVPILWAIHWIQLYQLYLESWTKCLIWFFFSYNRVRCICRGGRFILWRCDKWYL